MAKQQATIKVLTVGRQLGIMATAYVDGEAIATTKIYPFPRADDAIMGAKMLAKQKGFEIAPTTTTDRQKQLMLRLLRGALYVHGSELLSARILESRGVLRVTDNGFMDFPARRSDRERWECRIVGLTPELRRELFAFQSHSQLTT